MLSTGIAAMRKAASFTTTTPTSPTAQSSSIVTTLIARVRVAGFMAEPASAAGALRGVGVLVEPQSRSIRLRHRMPSLVPILARSAALIMEEPPEAFPHAGSRASVEVSTEEAVSMVAEVEAFTVAEAAGNLGFIHKKQLTVRRTQSCTRRI